MVTGQLDKKVKLLQWKELTVSADEGFGQIFCLESIFHFSQKAFLIAL